MFIFMKRFSILSLVLISASALAAAFTTKDNNAAKGTPGDLTFRQDSGDYTCTVAADHNSCVSTLFQSTDVGVNTQPEQTQSF